MICNKKDDHYDCEARCTHGREHEGKENWDLSGTCEDGHICEISGEVVECRESLKTK